jgi:hypothetical protein
MKGQLRAQADRLVEGDCFAQVAYTLFPVALKHERPARVDIGETDKSWLLNAQTA